MKKRFTAILLLAAMLFSAIACTGTGETTTEPESSDHITPAPETTNAPDETTAGAETMPNEETTAE